LNRRVVVTGIGLVTSLGIGTDATWTALLAGTSGAGPITHFDTEGFATRFACEVKGFDPLAFVEKKDVKKMDVFIQYAIAASHFAVADSGLAITPALAPEVGVCIGSGIGGFRTMKTTQRAHQGRAPEDLAVLHSRLHHQPGLGSGLDPVRGQGPEPGHLHGLFGVGARRRRLLRDHQARRRRRDDHGRVGGGHHADERRRLRRPARALDAQRRSDESLPPVRHRDRDGFIIGEGVGSWSSARNFEHAAPRRAIPSEIVRHGHGRRVPHHGASKTATAPSVR
jgi:3-oxoacyl-[acyl-carrier-protein] synthase II